MGIVLCIRVEKDEIKISVVEMRVNAHLVLNNLHMRVGNMCSTLVCFCVHVVYLCACLCVRFTCFNTYRKQWTCFADVSF